MSNLFSFSMKFEGREIMRAKVKKVKDIDPIINAMKLKFDGDEE